MTNALYKVTPGQAQPPLASDVNQYADALSGNADVGTITLASPISAPSSAGISGAAVAGAGLGIGAYMYKFTYVVGVKKSDNTIVYGNETSGSASISVTTTSGNQRITLSGLPTSWPSTAVGLRIYRTAVGGADGTQRLVTTITVPVASYTDTTADAALGANVPTTNSTGTTMPLTNVSGVLPVANGGTGSTTQNFVDLTSAQTIGGAKTFTGQLQINNPTFKQVGAYDTNIIPASGHLLGFTNSADTMWLLQVNDADGSAKAKNNILDDGNGNMTALSFNSSASMPSGGDLNNFKTLNAFFTFDTGNGAVLNTPYGTLAAGSAQVFEVRNTGYSGRIRQEFRHIYGNGQQAVLFWRLLDNVTWGAWNSVWDTTKLRTTNGYVEWNNNGTWQGVGGVKSVQRGTTSLSTGATNVTISAVNLSKAYVNFPTNVGNITGGSTGMGNVTAQLTSTTNLQFNATNVSVSPTVSWEVVESY